MIAVVDRGPRSGPREATDLWAQGNWEPRSGGHFRRCAASSLPGPVSVSVASLAFQARSATATIGPALRAGIKYPHDATGWYISEANSGTEYFTTADVLSSLRV
jgi:hypothetical protein